MGSLALPALEGASSEAQPWLRRQIEEAIEAIRAATPPATS
jgi:hypothetical protein